MQTALHSSFLCNTRPTPIQSNKPFAFLWALCGSHVHILHAFSLLKKLFVSFFLSSYLASKCCSKTFSKCHFLTKSMFLFCIFAVHFLRTYKTNLPQCVFSYIFILQLLNFIFIQYTSKNILRFIYSKIHLQPIPSLILNFFRVCISFRIGISQRGTYVYKALEGNVHNSHIFLLSFSFIAI